MYRAGLSLVVLATAVTASAQSRLFAPYVDMGLNNNNLTTLSQASGTKAFTMAFITSYNFTCQASWFGVLPVSSDTTYKTIVDNFKASGGEVIISFGGASGMELAQACTSVSSLQAQYQAVITKYGVKRVDFDIEGAAIADTAANDRRNQALAGLSRANSGLIISYTLPVLPSGLTQDGVNLLANAKTRGVSVAIVNVMAMDYGGPSTTMGQNAIDAANATLTQVRSVGLSSKIGITPMIGKNDVAGETFTLADAQKVVNYAKGNSNIALLAFWSVARDNGCPNGGVSPSCSGIDQSTWAFSRIFQGFSGPAQPDFSLSASPASQTVSPGSSATYSVSLSSFGGFSGSVALSASGLPSGASATFSPTSISGSGSSTLKVTTSGSTPLGTSNLSIKGVNGSLSRTSGVTLVVGAATAAAPTFSPPGGSFSTTQSVTLSSATAGASIRYTTNGSTPSATSGTVYSGPLTISSTTTVKAIAYKSGVANSSVSTATYTIGSGGGGSAWAPNTAYAVGVIVTYQGHTYKCQQAHTSIVTWEPPNTPALWLLLN